MDSTNLFYVMNIPLGFALIFCLLFYFMMIKRDIFIRLMYVMVCLCMFIDCINYADRSVYDIGVIAVFTVIGVYYINKDFNGGKKNDN